jgi:NADPH:quinone reductase
MRAVLMTAAGGPEVLQVAKLPEPEITGHHDVRVQLRAAGINPVDYKLRSGGTLGGTPPAVLGWDGAGVVESIGPAVTRVRPGDEVYFCDGGFGPVPGTYQEVKIVDERYLARKPERLSFAEAAAAPLVTITAWEALRERARVTQRQSVLVQAGAGGVGHMSVQIARLAGTQVATTVTPGPKAELAASLGAQLCIDYTRQDVGAKLRGWTGTDGADVVHDTVGGRTFTASFSLVRPYGDLGLECREPMAGRGDHRHAQPEPPGLLHLDAGAVGIRLAAAPRAPAGDPGTGRRALRRRRAARRGRRDVSPRQGRRRAPRPGSRPGNRQSSPHHAMSGPRPLSGHRDRTCGESQPAGQNRPFCALRRAGRPCTKRRK